MPNQEVDDYRRPPILDKSRLEKQIDDEDWQGMHHILNVPRSSGRQQGGRHKGGTRTHEGKKKR